MTAVQLTALVIKEPGWDEPMDFPLTLYVSWCQSLGERSSTEWFNEAIWALNQLLPLVRGRLQEQTVRSYLAPCLQGLGRHEEAVSLLLTILAEQPTDPALVDKCRRLLQISEAALAGGAASP